MSFKKNFFWGAATAAYQIEGAAYEDGKGLSVWDVFCKEPGKTWKNHTGDEACDHYHRYKEDVALMKEIGLKAYRLSISWPRVMPEGVGAVNNKGFDFYRALIDELLSADIEPFVTLHHWDLPFELHKRGGWLNPAISNWFAEYTERVMEHLSDRVQYWFTLNEPKNIMGMGYGAGRHAPGLQLGTRELMTVLHNILLAHGKSVMAIRANAKKTPVVGYAPNACVYSPYTDSKEDVEAARQLTNSINENDIGSNRLWLDPVFFGEYDSEAIEKLGKNMCVFTDADMKTIAQEIDFFGLNVYHSMVVRAGDDGVAETVYGGWAGGCYSEKMQRRYPLTNFHWPVVPECLYWGPKFFYERYKKPIIITENGLSSMDWVSLDGKVHDCGRIDFLHRHLLQLQEAAKDDIPIDGYFQWSFMDNFEWQEGYKERFGLVYVDYGTQQRIMKDSAYWYRDIINSNGEGI